MKEWSKDNEIAADFLGTSSCKDVAFMSCCTVVDASVVCTLHARTGVLRTRGTFLCLRERKFWNSCAEEKRQESGIASDGVKMPESTTENPLRSVVTADDFDDSFGDAADGSLNEQVSVFLLRSLWQLIASLAATLNVWRSCCGKG